MNLRAENICAELRITKELLATRQLCEYPEAVCLELAELGTDGKEHLLTSPAAEAWRNLRATAQSDGVALFIVSAFRSIERQTDIIRRKLMAGAPLEEILAVNAPPGFSEHHTGRAVDIATPGSPLLEIEFEETPAYRWMQQHANRFGFYLSFPQGNASGYQYEPWHWCFKDSDLVNGAINA